MSKFKVGDRVVRIGKSILSHGVIYGQTYTVASVDVNDQKEIYLQDDLPPPRAHYNPSYFVLEIVFTSPLYQALS